MLWAGGAVALAGSKVAGRWAVWQAMLAKSVAHKATAEMGSFRILMLLYDLPRPTRRGTSETILCYSPDFDGVNRQPGWPGYFRDRQACYAWGGWKAT